jgi:hypothetical protein
MATPLALGAMVKKHRQLLFFTHENRTQNCIQVDVIPVLF